VAMSKINEMRKKCCRSCNPDIFAD